MDGTCLSVGESLNRRLRDIESSFMYVRSEHFKKYVALRFLFYNAKSKWRLQTGHEHAEEANFHRVYNTIMKYYCCRCKTARADINTGFVANEAETTKFDFALPTAHATRLGRDLEDRASRSRELKRTARI